jgi:hypothetical protein
MGRLCSYIRCVKTGGRKEHGTTYCDRFHDTSDMGAAIQRPGTDSDVSYATVFRIHETTASIPSQRLGKQLLSLQRIASDKINVLPQNENTSPWQQILSTVNCFLSNQLVAMEG